jgi:hypothetical protein
MLKTGKRCNMRAKPILLGDRQWINYCLIESVKDQWQGTASELEKELTAKDSPVRHGASKLLHSSNICGIYLSRLQDLYPAEFEFKRTMQQRTWTLRNTGVLERR